MRFDDMITTMLARSEDQPSVLPAKWRQLADLLAQHGSQELGAAEGEALRWLEARRGEVSLATRREAARSLVGRTIAPAILGFFAVDHPSVAAPLMAGARLSTADWLGLLPGLNSVARGMLRHRRDLAPEVAQALAAFGPSDFALGGSVPDKAPLAAKASLPSLEQNEAQIRDLVARIEAFRKQRSSQAAAPFPAETRVVDSFRWETRPDGVLIWVEGAPRGPLVGQSIAAIAERGDHGVDGQAAGAFEKRAPFRDARFSVPGEGAASGAWRISGVPFFDPAMGAFLGYRGSARRPRIDEVARSASFEEAAPGLFGTGISADALRQLIHELRTPLNAIVGFAEMIDGQYMGPAALAYRSRAGEIMEQANRLLSAVDDLDTAARIETSRLQLEESATDAAALLCRLHDAFERVARQRDSRIAIEIAANLPAAKVELDVAERMFARLLAATTGLALPGEAITVTMAMAEQDASRGAGPMLCLAIDRPDSIAGTAEAALLDPGYSPEGDWPGAPALGLGFALRLVRNLAEAAGGRLVIGNRRFSLYLPAVAPEERSSGQGH